MSEPAKRYYKTLSDNMHLQSENARLKAEVEHLMVFCNCTLIPSKELQAKVERLTKVGNEMADYLFDAPYPCRIFYHKWIEAKEGKGQP